MVTHWSSRDLQQQEKYITKVKGSVCRIQEDDEISRDKAKDYVFVTLEWAFIIIRRRSSSKESAMFLQ